MAHQPTFKQLKYLCAVAESRHFGRAASACHVTQSTLSAGVQELEETLGVRLLERNKKQVFLTAVGREIVLRATQVLAGVDDLVMAASSAREPLTSELRLGVIPTIAPFLLPKVLPGLREDYPLLQLFIREDLSQNLLVALEQGTLDVLLFALPYPMENTQTMHLFDDRFVVAYPKRYAKSRKKKLNVEDLQAQDLLLLEDGHCLRDHAMQACKLRNTQIGIPYQATSLHTIVQMVDNGIGITLLPQMAISAEILSGTDIETREFSDKNVSRSIGLVWRKSSPREEEFLLLGNYLKEHRH